MLDEETRGILEEAMDGLSPDEIDGIVVDVVDTFKDIYGYLRAVKVTGVTVEGVWDKEDEEAVYSQAELIDLNLTEQEDELGLNYNEEETEEQARVRGQTVEEWLNEGGETGTLTGLNGFV